MESFKPKHTQARLLLIISFMLFLPACQTLSPNSGGASNWNRLESCTAPTAAEYYKERANEFHPAPPKGFLSTDLESTLNKLPFGQCEAAEDENHKLNICQDSISFTESGSFTSEQKIFSTIDQTLLYGNVSTDSNMFCNDTSFGVKFGSVPPDCEFHTVSYCNVEKDQVIALFNSGDIQQIGEYILSVQD